QAGIAAFEIDGVELVLFVRVPRERLAPDAYAGVLRLELADQSRHGIGGPEDLSVLEHERHGPSLRGAVGATRCREQSSEQERDRGESRIERDRHQRLSDPDEEWLPRGERSM